MNSEYRLALLDTQSFTCCLCSIADSVREDGQLLIHFDGWSAHYDYWAEPSTTDIHPIGWFGQCGHKYSQYNQKLQAPKGKRVKSTVVLIFILLTDCSFVNLEDDTCERYFHSCKLLSFMLSLSVM